jgi:uncharacterized protein YecE (DUF72 family)
MAGAVMKLAGEDEDSLPGDEGAPRDVYVFFNNHWQAQGAINALQLAIELGLKTPEDLPEIIRKRLGL